MDNDKRVAAINPTRKSMANRGRAFRFRLTVAAVSAVAVILILPGASSLFAAAPLPAAKDILTSVRLGQARERIDLDGQLRQNAVVVPFHLVQDQGTVRYVFSDPPETLQLAVGEKDSDLQDISAAGTKKIAQFDRKVRGTDITLEDLALKFLYWSNAEVVGTEKVLTRDCWKLELQPPSRQVSQYSRVLLWIDKNSGALMRLQGFDWNNQLTRRFEVVSAQKIGDRWFLKQMRIEALQPGTSHVASRTYLEIKR